ncbi:hypothetical protein BOX15_Mlig026912g1, partial [Macrostomum lignano]
SSAHTFAVIRGDSPTPSSRGSESNGENGNGNSNGGHGNGSSGLSNSSYEEFEAKLDAAAIEGVGVIIVEPALLGCATARWIACGNFLHKSAVLSALGASCCAGLGAWGCGAAFAASSCASAGAYELLWACDPVSWYQVERDLSQLRYTLPYAKLSAPCVTVLRRRDTTRRRVLHCTAALIAAGLAAYWLSTR